MHIDVISACAACLSLLELVLEGDLAETKLKLKIQGLEALLAPLASAATEPQPTAQALLKWIDVSDKTGHADFARYCARCGIIDQRCLITQLRGCDESLKSAIKRIFSHGDALVALLVQRKRAAAVKTALDGLVERNGVESKAAETFYEVVRKAKCPNGRRLDDVALRGRLFQQCCLNEQCTYAFRAASDSCSRPICALSVCGPQARHDERGGVHVGGKECAGRELREWRAFG
jgi:hypothetical protein